MRRMAEDEGRRGSDEVPRVQKIMDMIVASSHIYLYIYMQAYNNVLTTTPTQQPVSRSVADPLAPSSDNQASGPQYQL